MTRICLAIVVSLEGIPTKHPKNYFFLFVYLVAAKFLKKLPYIVELFKVMNLLAH